MDTIFIFVPKPGILIDEINYKGGNSAVAIGIFDGVHKGHQAILRRLLEISEKDQLNPVLITFWPHPRKVLKINHNDLRFITSPKEKESIVCDNGIENYYVLEFTPELASISPGEFMQNILMEKFHCRHLLLGYNQRFGRNRQGGFDEYQAIAAKIGLKLEKAPAVSVEGKKVSSSVIRSGIISGNIMEVSKLLGYNYFLQGKIIGGMRIGRKIGFPTANIEVSFTEKLIPKDGVYAVRCKLKDKSYSAMLNIGFRPTIDSGLQRSIEVHLFNFSGDVYNEDIKVSFMQRIRDEMKFDGLDQLRIQLLKDKTEALKIFKDLFSK